MQLQRVSVKPCPNVNPISQLYMKQTQRQRNRWAPKLSVVRLDMQICEKDFIMQASKISHGSM